MPRLVDLDPSWIRADGAEGRDRMGVMFVCPACRDPTTGYGHMQAVWFANPPDGGSPAPHQPGYPPGDPRWTRSGDTFETLTLTPSINTSCWHGWVKSGDVTTC